MRIQGSLHGLFSGFAGTPEEDARNASAKVAAVTAYQAGAPLTAQQEQILAPKPVTTQQQLVGQQLVAQAAIATAANEVPFASGLSQAEWNDWTSIFYATKPNVQTTTANAGVYANLSNTHLKFLGGNEWPQAISPPHYTTALDWCQPNVLNAGNPQSLYDPEEYLRSALIDSDWDKIYNFFLYNYAVTYKAYANSKAAFFPYANINILQYKYVIDANGNKVYYPFSLYDIKQFLMRIVAYFTVADVQHSSGHCAIGLVNWGAINLGEAAQVIDPSQLDTSTPYQWLMALKSGLNNPQQGASSVLQYEPLYQLVASAHNPRHESIPCGNFRVGWIQGPEGEWNAEKIITIVIIVAITYGIALYATPEIAAVDAATVATTTASTAGTTSAAVTAAPAIIGAGLEEVVVTGVVGTSVGAAIATGAVVGAIAAPIVAGVGSPTLTAPQINAPPLEEVVVNGTIASAPSAGVVGAVTAGSAIVATTAPAIFSTPTITAPDTLENVDVIGHATPAPSAGSVAAATAAGTIVATSAPAISNAVTVSDPNTTTQPDNTGGNDAPSQGQTLQDWLKALVKKYGLDWVKAHLLALLKQFYGHTPTQAQLDDANASLSSGINWWIIGAAALAAIAGSS